MAIGFARLSCCFALLVALGAPARAVTYSFTGQCTDCFGGVGSATATLILQDYTPGDPLQSSNLVSFSYDGTDLLAAYVVTPANLGAISGSIPEALPSFASVAISVDPLAPGFLNRAFASLLDGEWGIDDDGPDDFGTNGTWSLVPEPGTSLLVAVGMLALGIARRPRR